MGQYFKCCILAENKRTPKKWMYSHDYDNGLKLMEHSWMKNNFVGAFESLLVGKPQIVVWAGDYAENDKDLKSNIYHRCFDSLKINPPATTVKQKYIVNHTTKQFVDKTKVINRDGWKIHPLPLLTCEGNGSGGGDYYGQDHHKIVGSWARNIISVEARKPKGYTELVFDLFE